MRTLMPSVICVLMMKVHFGRWLIDGYPNVILFNIAKARDRLDEWRKVGA